MKRLVAFVLPPPFPEKNHQGGETYCESEVSLFNNMVVTPAMDCLSQTLMSSGREFRGGEEGVFGNNFQEEKKFKR